MNYIVHSTSKENLIETLETGILYANKYIAPSKRRISPTEELPYIYTVLYVPNLPYELWSNRFIFHPKILELEPSIFNYGWITHPNNKSIYIYTDDDKDMKQQKIKKMIDYVKTTTTIMDQEILFIACILLNHGSVPHSIPTW